jgi:glycosyltransferase involved in cell wall biosynthesis
MNIAALLPHVEVFGGVRRYLELGNALARRGHRFVLFTPEGVPPAWLEFSGAVRPFSAIGEESFDFGLCSEYSILDAFDRLQAEARFFYFVLEGHKREKEVAGRPYRFLGNSAGICRRMELNYGIVCRRASGGINPELFHPVDVPEAERPAEGEFRVLCYGRIHKRRKGVSRVIRAVEGLSNEFPRISLVFFDSLVGQDRCDPRSLIKTRVPHEFHLDLPQDRMAWLFSRADVFVSAERRAGWSNTTAEAMACGLPVVCTPSGTRDFAFNGRTALVVSKPYAFLLRRQVRKLIRDGALRRRLAGAGREKIMEFTWDLLAARLEGIFRNP